MKPILFAMPANPVSTARLLIACPDARGIVAAVARFIAEHGGNLLDADQHTDREHGEFFMRVEFDLTDCNLTPENFEQHWSPLAKKHLMDWRVRFNGASGPRVAILVGTLPHCLHDLLWRKEAGELPIEIPAIISNHAKLEPIAAHADIPFHHLPVEGDRAAQERAILNTLDREKIDLVVLARYMQVLTPDFLRGWENRIINIHHSFLPAFAGGDPYRQAYDRGVKVIGATSHYVTDVLDDGPIIAQDVVHVSHRDSVDDLKRKGRDLERIVLARAVRAHVHDRVLVSKNKTVVFE